MRRQGHSGSEVLDKPWTLIPVITEDGACCAVSCPGVGVVLCKGVGEATGTRRSGDFSVNVSFPALEEVSLLLYQGVLVPLPQVR